MELRSRSSDHPQPAAFSTTWAIKPCAVSQSATGTGPRLQLWEPRNFEWNQVRTPIRSLPDGLEGLRILHVSDLHMQARWWPVYDELIERIQRDPPDLLLFTGDFVESKRNHVPAVPFVHRLLDGFTARLGCFAILGNHDRYHFAPRLDGTPVTLLNGQTARIDHQGSMLEIIGLPGVHRRDLTNEFVASCGSKAPGTLRIILSHYPDHIRRTGSLRPDLFLAGHTHGGQVCLPGRIPILRHDSLPRRLCSGVHSWNDTWLVVSRGFGFSGLPVRAFCPSEVIELTLTRTMR